MNALGKAARVELRGTGVHVMTVCPGYIATDFGANAVKGKDRMRLGTGPRRGIGPERVAQAVLRGYLKRKREVVVPWTDRFFMTIYQLFPSLVEGSMARMLTPGDEVVVSTASAKKNS